jgi:hypothetical protein
MVRGVPGQVRAVPGDDLPHAVRGQRAEQVVGGGEQLAGGRPGPAWGKQLIRQIGVQLREGAPFVHDAGSGDQRGHRRHPPGERALLQGAGVLDEAVVAGPQLVEIPGPLRHPVRDDARHDGGPERGRGGDAQLGELADHVDRVIPRSHPQPVVQRGEAQPAELLAQRVAGGPVLLGNGERDQAPHAVPRL